MASDVILEIGADTRRAANQLAKFRQSSITGFKAVAAAAVAAFAGKQIIDGIKDVTNLASIQENAVNKLNTALKLAGDFSNDASQDMQQFASDLQSVTTLGDEATIEMLALSKAFGTTNEESKKLVEAAADLSAALGIPIETAVRNLGKTKGGLAGELGELVPALRGVEADALKAGAAIDIVAKRFAGAAKAARDTFAGGVTAASNAFGDLKEEIGFVITQNPALRKVISTTEKLFGSLGTAVKSNRDALTNFLTDDIIVAVKGFEQMIRAFKLISPLFDVVKVGFLGIASAAITVGSGFSQMANAIGLAKAYIKGDSIEIDNAFQSIEDEFSDLQSVLGSIRSGFEFKLADSIRDGADKAIDGLKDLQKELKKTQKKGALGFGATKTANASAGGEKEESKGDPKGALLGFGSAAVAAFKAGGEEGAKQFVGAAGVAIGTALGGPVIGQVVGQIIDLLTTDGIPRLIDSVVENIPTIAQRLGENMPIVAVSLAKIFADPRFYVEFSIAFVKGMASGITEVASEFVGAFKFYTGEGWINFTNQFKGAAVEARLALVKAFKDSISYLKTRLEGVFLFIRDVVAKPFLIVAELWKNVIRSLENLIGKLDVTGGIKNAGTSIVEGLGFSQGGTVPNGFPNDTFPARLTSGETVIKRDTSESLDSFLERQGNVEALLSKIAAAVSAPMNVQTAVAVDGQAFADIQLELSRQGARTA